MRVFWLQLVTALHRIVLVPFHIMADAADAEGGEPAPELLHQWCRRYRNLQQARVMLLHLGIAAEEVIKSKLECEAFCERVGQDPHTCIQEYDDCLEKIANLTCLANFY